MKKIMRFAFACLFVLTVANTTSTNIYIFASDKALPEYLPEELEIELALSAGPEVIRKDASVMVLTESGYKKVKEGTNGFLCLVVRGNARFPDILAPICYDEEGAKTVARVHIDAQNLRKQGVEESEVQQQITQGFQSGKYKAPQKSGLIYMLSPVVYVPDTEERGKMMTYIPHYMVYAPYLTAEEIGFESSVISTKKHMFSGLPFINGNGPHKLLVIPVGEKERAEIAKEHKQLISKMKAFLPLEIN